MSNYTGAWWCLVGIRRLLLGTAGRDLSEVRLPLPGRIIACERNFFPSRGHVGGWA
jgi:hypothetical protein